MKKIACRNLTISYNQHPVIHHLNVEFKVGTTNAVIGPNGAGKSTLLRAILGDLKPDSGTIVVEGIQRSEIAYLPQVTEIDVSVPFTVEDVLLLGLLYDIGLCKGVPSSMVEKVNYTLAQVGLTGFNNRQITQLSKGQLQRVFLAKIIMQEANVIVLDEPFNAMDSRTTDDLLCTIRRWADEGKTIIAVLHDLSHISNNFEYTLLIAKELIDFGFTKEVITTSNLEKAYKTSFNWSNKEEICNISI